MSLDELGLLDPNRNTTVVTKTEQLTAKTMATGHFVEYSRKLQDVPPLYFTLTLNAEQN